MITIAIDTYVTLTEARDYALNNDIDLPSDDSELELLLKRSTKFIDRKFGNQFMGYIATPGQPLAWPRLVTNVFSYKGEVWNYTMDADGNPRDFSNIPKELKEAVIETSVLLDTIDVYAQPNAAVTSEMVKVGELTSQTAYANATGYRADPLYLIKLILRPLINPNTGLKLSRGK